MFKFWCQKVLPLVYDNSLSYYEVLCKLTKHINDIGDQINKIEEYIDSVIGEIPQFIKKTGDIAKGTFFFNAPDVEPGNGTIIVNQNDSEENAVIRVQNTGNRYGIMLRVSRSGNRGIIDSSAIVYPDGTKEDGAGDYKFIIYKDTQNRVRSPQPILSYNTGNLLQVWGSGSTTSVQADAFNQVVLTGTNGIRTAVEESFYSIVNGGVRVEESGVYRVCGGVYMTASTDGGATSKDVYIRKGTGTFESATEVSGASDNVYTGGQQGAHSNVNVNPKIVYATAGDVFYLVCRIRDGAGSFNPTVNGTYFLIERVA